MKTTVNPIPSAPPLRGAASSRPVIIRLCRNNSQPAYIFEKQFPRSLFALFDDGILSAEELLPVPCSDSES